MSGNNALIISSRHSFVHGLGRGEASGSKTRFTLIQELQASKQYAEWKKPVHTVGLHVYKTQEDAN